MRRRVIRQVAPTDEEERRVLMNLVSGDMKRRAVEKKYEGKIGPLRKAVTQQRGSLVEAFLEWDDARLARHGGAGGGDAPGEEVLRVTSDAAAPSSKEKDVRPVEVKPYMRLKRQKNKPSSKALDATAVRRGYGVVTAEEFQKSVRTSQEKLRRGGGIPMDAEVTARALAASINKGITEALSEKIDDVDFVAGDKLPKKLASSVRDVPVAVLGPLREWVEARRAHEEISGKKEEAMGRASARFDGAASRSMDILRRDGVTRQMLNATVGKEGKRVAVNVCVKIPQLVHPKVTRTWLKEQLEEVLVEFPQVATALVRGIRHDDVDGAGEALETLEDELAVRIRGHTSRLVKQTRRGEELKPYICVELARRGTQDSTSQAENVPNYVALAPVMM